MFSAGFLKKGHKAFTGEGSGAETGGPPVRVEHKQ